MISDEKLREIFVNPGAYFAISRDAMRRIADAIIAANLGGGRRIEWWLRMHDGCSSKPGGMEVFESEPRPPNCCPKTMPRRLTGILHDPPQPKELTLDEARMAARLAVHKMLNDVARRETADCDVVFAAIDKAIEAAKQPTPAPQPKSAEERVGEALEYVDSFLSHFSAEKNDPLVKLVAILRGERP